MYSDEEKLDVALEMSGIDPPPQDKEKILHGFTNGLGLSALIFSVAEARYEEPGLIFSARV